MGDVSDHQIFKISQATSVVEKMEVEPPATAGRRRRKNCRRGSSAKPRGRVRKPTSDAGGKRGRTRQARAAAQAFVAPAAAATPQRPKHGGCVKAETAEEAPLQTITTERESIIDQQADMYLSKIVPDPATIVYPERGSVQGASCSDNPYGSCEEPANPSPQRRRGGRAPRPTPVRRRRRVAIDGDERIVCEAQTGRWSSLLPVGTVVRRPSAKLVELIAQAIHESPHRVLRVAHVYVALQNRYPYYKLQDKKGISSWKSSVRHALFQKWFVKLRPTTGMCENVRPRSFFWGLNYSNRPREWQMPRGLARLSLPTDDEAELRDDGACTLFSGLPLNTETPSKNTTALRPSAFRLELERQLFPLPEPQSPARNCDPPAVPCSEFPPVTSAPQSVDDVVSLGSPSSSLPHIAPDDLWKTETVNPGGWPAPGRAEEQAWQQPSISASAAPSNLWDITYCKPVSAPPFPSTTTTSMTGTMASQPTAAALVEALVDSFQKAWQSLPSEQFVQLQQEQQQQQVVQQPLLEPPQQQQQEPLQMLQAPLLESQEQQQLQQQMQELQEAFREYITSLTTQQGGLTQEWLRLMDSGCPDNIFDYASMGPEERFWASINFFIGSVAFGHDEPLAPCAPLCSPSYITQTTPSQTPLPTAPPTRAQYPPQQPPAIPGPSLIPEEVVLRPMPQEQSARLENTLRRYGLLPGPDSNECTAYVNAPWTVWNNLIRRGVIRRSAESRGSGERVDIAALVVAPPSAPVPTDIDNGGFVFSDEADRSASPPSTGRDDGRSLPVDQADCGKPGSPPS